MSELETPLDMRLPRPLVKKLAGAGYYTVGDLLLTAPKRYDHWGRLTPMSRLSTGEDVTLLAEVVSQRLVANRNRGGVRLEVVITDGTHRMQATFFAQNQWKLGIHQKLLRVGEEFLFAGKVGSYKGHLQLTHPQFEGTEGDHDDLQRAIERPIPIYSAGSGVTTWVMSRAVGMLLDKLESLGEEALPDPVPSQIRQRYHLPSRARTLRWLHRPENDEQHKAARTALAWEEAWVLQTHLALVRRSVHAYQAPASPRDGNAHLVSFLTNLPFTLTPAQTEAIERIGEEIEGTRPMQRLLQADVGAGKTLVALAALVQVVGAGHQGVLLAPTEVLAEQHVSSIRALLAPLESDAQTQIPVVLLTSSTPLSQRRTTVERVQSGEPLILVGTHALLQDDVAPTDLALVVVDEQHRFGVAQRDHLRTAGTKGVAHQLIMTATPIPRTIAMTVFGDLDCTRMEGLPPGRTPVRTHLVDAGNETWMNRMWERAREEIDAGGRVYVVCPRIDQDEGGDSPVGSQDEENEETDTERRLAAVHSVAEELRHAPTLAGITINELTGRTPASLKAQIMDDFARGDAPLLVATTVVEVGVDVPEATMMVILDAQQFGLSQLHQLRGRVGRGQRNSVCMAVHRHGISGMSAQRLAAFADTTDGFRLAEVDLRVRREGDVLGAEQSGRSSRLRYVSVVKDAQIIATAREEVHALLEKDPALLEYPALLAHVHERSGEELAWMERS